MPILSTNFISRGCYAKMVVCVMFGFYNNPQKLSYKNIKFRCPREKNPPRKWLWICIRNDKLRVVLPVFAITISNASDLNSIYTEKNKSGSRKCWILQSWTVPTRQLGMSNLKAGM